MWMDAYVALAHRKKWGRVEFETFLKWDIKSPAERPEAQRVLAEWPEKYSGVTEWPPELRPKPKEGIL